MCGVGDVCGVVMSAHHLSESCIAKHVLLAIRVPEASFRQASLEPLGWARGTIVKIPVHGFTQYTLHREPPRSTTRVSDDFTLVPQPPPPRPLYHAPARPRPQPKAVEPPPTPQPQSPTAPKTPRPRDDPSARRRRRCSSPEAPRRTRLSKGVVVGGVNLSRARRRAPH